MVLGAELGYITEIFVWEFCVEEVEGCVSCMKDECLLLGDAGVGGKHFLVFGVFVVVEILVTYLAEHFSVDLSCMAIMHVR
jgi:hypothetical protein